MKTDGPLWTINTRNISNDVSSSFVKIRRVHLSRVTQKEYVSIFYEVIAYSETNT